MHRIGNAQLENGSSLPLHSTCSRVSELAGLPKHTFQVVVAVVVQSSLEAVPATPVVVVIVAVATGPEAVPGQRVVNPNPMPLSRVKRGSFDRGHLAV